MTFFCQPTSTPTEKVKKILHGKCKTDYFPVEMAKHSQQTKIVGTTRSLLLFTSLISFILIG